MVWNVAEVQQQRHEGHLGQCRAQIQQGHAQILAGAGVNGQAHEKGPDKIVADGFQHQAEGDADGEVADQHRNGNAEGRGQNTAIQGNIHFLATETLRGAQ